MSRAKYAFVSAVTTGSRRVVRLLWPRCLRPRTFVVAHYYTHANGPALASINHYLSAGGAPMGCISVCCERHNVCYHVEGPCHFCVAVASHLRHIASLNGRAEGKVGRRQSDCAACQFASFVNFDLTRATETTNEAHDARL